MHKVVRVNASGLRVGEDHPKAKLTNREVDMVRQLYDDGTSITDLAAKFDVNKSCIFKIVNCLTRAQFPVATRSVPIPED